MCIYIYKYNIGNVIIPTDKLISFRGVAGKPDTGSALVWGSGGMLIKGEGGVLKMLNMAQDHLWIIHLG